MRKQKEKHEKRRNLSVYVCEQNWIVSSFFFLVSSGDEERGRERINFFARCLLRKVHLSHALDHLYRQLSSSYNWTVAVSCCSPDLDTNFRRHSVAVVGHYWNYHYHRRPSLPTIRYQDGIVSTYYHRSSGSVVVSYLHIVDFVALGSCQSHCCPCPFDSMVDQMADCCCCCCCCCCSVMGH